MAQRTWDNEITKNQDWGGDATTNNLPVSGNRVQEFIKNALENKMGTIYYDTTNNRYLIFSDVANKNEYLEDTTKVDLILGTFDAPFNRTTSITLLSSINNVIFSGDKGNIIEFTFDIVDKYGNSTLESVNVTYSFISNGVKKSVTEQYSYGETVRFNIDSYLGNGETIVQIAMVGLTTLTAITRSVSYRVLDLSVDSNYDISQVNELSVSQFVQIPFYTKSSRHLFLRASVDYGAWELVMETDTYETNGTYSLNVGLLGAGVHNIRFQAYNIIDGVTYYSNYVYRDILLNQNNQLNTNQIMIAGNVPSNVDDSEFKLYGITQYVPASVKIAVFNPVSSTTTVDITLVKGENTYQLGSKSLTNYQVENITFTPVIFGAVGLKINASGTNRTIVSAVSASPIQINEITNQLVLSLKALGRSNSDVNKYSWAYGEYSSLFKNFSWDGRSGWNDNRLKINYGAYVDINIAPLANNPENTGYTMEFEFSTELINDENAVLIDLRNGEKGLLLTASKASLTSANGRKVETNFKGGENVRIAFVIDNAPILTSKLMYIYINGVISGAIDFLNTDNFNVTNTLRIGNTQEAVINIKDIRFYNRALSSNEILNNYMLYQDTSDEMLNIFNRNNVLVDGSMSSNALANNLPVMIITGDVSQLENTTNKNLPITVNVTYINRQDPTKSFTMENAQMRPQGTSSMFYPKKNFRLYTLKNNNTIVRDYLGSIVPDKLYAFKSGSIPVSTWCMKADFAESSGSHNTGIARLWNDALYNMQINIDGTPTHACRTQAQQSAIDNNYPYDVRTTVDGFPIVMFYHVTESDPLIFLGKYNFNNDKSTENVFGFKGIPGFNNSRMQCWEVLDSGNPYALFTGDPSAWAANWANAYEGRYPDSSTNTTDLEAFYTWVYNNKENQVDFDAQMGNHLDLYKMAAYYVYLMRFGAVDQVAKNAMLTSEDGIHFYFINYDNDTILGLDNDGKLVYDWRIDRQSKITGTNFYVYAAHDSALWNRLEGSTYFMELVKKVDQALFEARKGITNVGLTYENVIEMFNTKQSLKWCERVYNEDAKYKYLGPYKNNSTDNLAKLQGRRNLHRAWWLSNRFNYLDGKWMTGAFTKDGITFKCHAGSQGTTLRIVSGSNMYFGIKVQSTMIQSQYLEIGQGYDFAIDRDLQIGSPVSICNPANVAEINLSNFMINLASLDVTLVRNSLGETRLKKLILGNTLDSNNMISNISGLNNAVALQELNIEGFSLITTLSLGKQYDLRKLYALRSGIRDIDLCPGCPLDVLQLPNSITRLSLDSHANLTNANLNINYDNILELSVKNCSALNTFAMFTSYMGIATNKSDILITLWGINWSGISGSQFLSLLNGLTPANINFRGTIYLNECSREEAISIKSIFGEHCFDMDNELYIHAPDAVYIDGPSSIKEGESAQFSCIVFSENPGTIVYSISSGSRAGVSINSSTGVLTTTENGISDSTLKIKAMHAPAGGIGSVSFAERNIIIKKIVYPTSGNLNGPETIEQQENYSLNLSPIGFNGSYSIAWSITGNGASLVELLTTNSSSCTIKVNTFFNNVPFNIVATVTPTGKTPFTVSKTVMILNANIAISATVNPDVMSKLYAAGLCSNSQYMYKSEAAAVTDLGILLKGMTDSSGSFLKWFTGLTSLGNNCFQGCEALTSIAIPDSITSIGNSCFRGCYKLTSITIPSGVTSIGTECFYGCSALTSITLPEGITSLGNYCFYSCSALTAIALPSGVTSIGNSCFNNCSALTSITLPNSITSLGNHCFYGCSALASITLPDSITSLGNNCFFGCSSLTSITIPSGVTSIGTECFYGCASLTFITLPEGITSLGNGCFSNCSKLTSITLPSGITSLENDCFYGCSKLTSITLPDSITSIGNSCFNNCSALTSIALPVGITSIRDYCFNNCSALASITLPNSITSLGNYCFANCSALASITLPVGITSLGNNCFANSSKLTSITLPDSITSLGNYCFNNCSALASVTLPVGITSIKDTCFYGCSALASITIPSGVTSLGNYCFANCSALASITLPNSITSIGNYCFSNSYKLTSIALPDSITSIGNYCFANCSVLASIIIPSGITSIRDNCFYGCSALTSITLPNSITSIGNSCFSGCLNLHTMTIYAPTSPTVFSNTFGDSSSSYTGYTSKPNTLYVLANATGYESWSANLFDANKCGFVLQKTL